MTPEDYRAFEQFVFVIPDLVRDDDRGHDLWTSPKTTTPGA